jgi:phenylalanine-4-hydroxylase
MENGFEETEEGKSKYTKKEGIFRYKDASVPGGYRYEITNTVLRELGEPDANNLPCGLALYPDLMPGLIDEDMVLLPHVRVIYSEADHDLWRRLFVKIEQTLSSCVVKEVEDGYAWIKRLGGANKIPKLETMNKDIKAASGFELVQVMGLIPSDTFFKLLMQGKFPVTLSVRREEELSYTSFPDIFHDLAGHAPMFLNQDFCHFVRKIGDLGMRFSGEKRLQGMVSKLYWYTIEFGLKAAEAPNFCRAYGAGIVSSPVETRDSVESVTASCFDTAGNRIEGNRIIRRLPFNLERVLLSHYDFAKPQELYFVIDDYRQLSAVFEQDIEKYIRQLAAQKGEYEIPQGMLLETDIVLPGRQTAHT